MECPACSSELVETKAAGIEIDICSNGCGGVWFDRDEITRFDEAHELLPQDILSAKRSSEYTLNPFPRKCPRCSEQHLMRQSYDPKNPVEIDACWRCGGIWLDIGELEAIRKGGGDREAAGNAFLKSSIDLCSFAQEKKGEFAEGAKIKSLLSRLKAVIYED